MKSKKAIHPIGLIVAIVILLILAGVVISFAKNALPSYAKKLEKYNPTPITGKEEFYYKNISIAIVPDKPYTLQILAADPEGRYVSYFSPYTGFKAWEDKTQTIVTDARINPRMYTVFLLDARATEITSEKNIVNQIIYYMAERERGAVYYITSSGVVQNNFVAPAELNSQLAGIPLTGIPNIFFWDGMYSAINGTTQVNLIEAQLGQQFMKNIFVISHGSATGTLLTKVNENNQIVPMSLDETKTYVTAAFNSSEDVKLFLIDFAGCTEPNIKLLKDANWNTLPGINKRVFCYSATKDGLAEGELEKIANDMFADFNKMDVTWRPIAKEGSHNITIHIISDSNKGKFVFENYVYQQ